MTDFPDYRILTQKKNNNPEFPIGNKVECNILPVDVFNFLNVF